MVLATAVRRFIDGYFATCERSEKTRKAYLCDLRQFASFAGRRKPLASVGPDTVEGWISSLRAAGYAPASMRRKAASLKVFFGYWVRRAELVRSPFWRVRLSLGSPERLPRCLREQEARLLLRYTRENADRNQPVVGAGLSKQYLGLRDSALVDLLFATGIRVGEAASLDCGDYRPEDRAFHVIGKGGRSRLALLATAATLDLQRRYLRMRRSIPAKSPALFLNAQGGRLSTQGMTLILRRMAGEASIRRRVTPHMLRHTVASLLLRNGADLREVQEFLGHSSITTTQRYTHVAKRQLRHALKRHHPSLKLL